MVEYTGEPRAFLRQKSRILPIRAPVLEVDLAMSDVPVAAENDFASAGRETMQMRDHHLEELELDRQAHLGRRARGQIERDYAEVAELRFDVAPFCVDIGNPQSLDDSIGWVRAVQCDAAVATFLRAVEVTAQATGVEHARSEIAGLRFDLLQTDDIGALRRHPGQQPFVDGSSYAV